MRPHAQNRARLARMESARAETERHIAIIERQIAAHAERLTINTHVKSRQFGRGTSRWSPADERTYQEAIAALRFERRNEIEALSRKLARQAGAIAAFRVLHRIDNPEREDA